MALTADINQETRKECLNLGMNKPINLRILLSSIKKYSDKNDVGEPNIKILITDDSNINRDVISLLLTKIYDFDITTAESGEQSIDLAAKTNYDIIFMDGIQASKKINPKTKIIYDVMDDILPKPFNKLNLIEILNKYTSYTHKESINIKKTKNIIDFNIFIDIVGKNHDLEKTLLNTFIYQFTESISKISDELKKVNINNIHNIAHKLSGSSAQLGIKYVSDIAKDIEKLTSLEELNKKLFDLKLCLQTLQKNLNNILSKI